MTPDNVKTATEKPDKRPQSPCSRQPLKVSSLFKLNLVKDEEACNGKGDVKYMCPVSQKQIVHQKVIAIKTTGTVMIKDYYEKYVKAEGVDPVTGKKFKKSDVVELIGGGSGFAGHEDSQ